MTNRGVIMRGDLLKYCISAISVLFIMLHMIFPFIVIDPVTLGLFAIAILPWLTPLFKNVELPGGLKVEFQDLVKTEKKADELGLLASASDVRGYTTKADYIREKTDPNMALATLRFDFVAKLRGLAKRNDINVDESASLEVVRLLEARQILKKNESQFIKELLGLFDSAVHGAKVETDAIEWVNNVGPRILYALDNK